MKLLKIPFSHIHEIIRTEIAPKQIEKALGVRSLVLERYLAKFRYKGAPLSIQRLRDIEPEQLLHEYAENYHTTWIPKPVVLEELNFSEIHRAILRSSLVTQCSVSLGVNTYTLERYLRKLTYDGAPLSYEILRELTVQEMESHYCDTYHTPWKPKTIVLEELNFNEIHKVILQSKTKNNCASNLGVTYETLESYLNSLFYHGAPLSYKRLQELTVEEIESTHNDTYHTPWKPESIALEELNFSEIHKVILQSNSITDCVLKLCVRIPTLERYLGRLTYDGAPLSYKRLQELTVEEIESTHSDTYHTPWKPRKVFLIKLNFSEIHEAILQSTTLGECASGLGVNDRTLERYLSRLEYEQAPLSYERLQRLSAQEMESAHIDTYHTPWIPRKIVLTNLKLSEMHQLACESKNLTKFASNIGVTRPRLNNYLKQFTLDGITVSYEYLKEKSPEELQQKYADTYYLPLGHQRISSATEYKEENLVVTMKTAEDLSDNYYTDPQALQQEYPQFNTALMLDNSKIMTEFQENFAINLNTFNHQEEVPYSNIDDNLNDLDLLLEQEFGSQNTALQGNHPQMVNSEHGYYHSQTYNQQFDNRSYYSDNYPIGYQQQTAITQIQLPYAQDNYSADFQPQGMMVQGQLAYPQAGDNFVAPPSSSISALSNAHQNASTMPYPTSQMSCLTSQYIDEAQHNTLNQTFPDATLPPTYNISGISRDYLNYHGYMDNQPQPYIQPTSNDPSGLRDFLLNGYDLSTQMNRPDLGLPASTNRFGFFQAQTNFPPPAHVPARQRPYEQQGRMTEEGTFEPATKRCRL